MKMHRIVLTAVVMSSFMFSKNSIISRIGIAARAAAELEPGWLRIREVMLPPSDGRDGPYQRKLAEIVVCEAIEDSFYEIDREGNVYVGKSSHPLTTSNAHQLSWGFLVQLHRRVVRAYFRRVRHTRYLQKKQLDMLNN